MKKANSTDPAKFGPEIFNDSFTGATGTVAFDAKGDRKDAEMTIFKLEGGKVKPIAIVKGGVSTPFVAEAAAAAPAAAPAAPAKEEAKKGDAKPAEQTKEEPKKEERRAATSQVNGTGNGAVFSSASPYVPWTLHRRSSTIHAGLRLRRRGPGLHDGLASSS